LGRAFPLGTIFDPATTRSITRGHADPVTGLIAENSGYVRDPFPGNIIPAGRLDANALKLLQLLPEPNAPGIFNNYISTPTFRENIDQFAIRADQILADRDQIFFRFSWVHDDRVRPGPFPGIADGSNPLNDASLQDHSLGGALSETHTFSSSLINEVRAGLSRERALFVQPYADTMGIPEQYGIQGIPQEPLNGGLPMISVGTLTTFGSPYYVPSDKYSTTYQIADNVTKIVGSHSFRAGAELQHIVSPFTQPPFSRGFMNYSGAYTSIPNQTDGSTGVAQFLLTPTTTNVPDGVSNVGGMSQVYFSGFKENRMSRDYYGLFVQDDWKLNSKLTLNLGLRWEYFGRLYETRGDEANFDPGTSSGGATYWVPEATASTIPQNFISALQTDGIAFATSSGDVLGTAQKHNFSPRLGVAYQILSKLVLRAGYGLFYGGYQEVDLGSPLVLNFPFQYYLTFLAPNSVAPITPDNSIGNLETTFANISLSPSSVPIAGVSLTGDQFHWQTPYTQNFNRSTQYQLGRTASLTLAYVGSQGRHLITALGANNVTELLPPDTNPQLYVPFPDFARGSTYIATVGTSNYNSLQASVEKHLSSGLNFLANYTWGKVRTDVRDPAENDIGGYRAPAVPGFGISRDYALADFDVRQIFHFSGGYELPFGSGKRFLTDVHGLTRQLVGGWSVNWILTLQDGQPFTIPCTVTTGAGTGCNAVLVPGENPIGGPHNVNQWLNPAAFANPSVVATIGQTDFSPLGGAPTQVVGPGFHRLDFSTFKQFQTSETTHFEFRAEFFNLSNTPNFAQPSFTNFLDTSTFGKITATRDAPNDAREIQFARKFYW
jgi:TonB dependent receptor